MTRRPGPIFSEPSSLRRFEGRAAAAAPARDSVARLRSTPTLRQAWTARWAFCWLIAAGLFLPSPAAAVPQFDARFGSAPMPGHEGHLIDSYGLSCGDCHVNPTGGGLRNAHGREVMRERLPMVREEGAEFEAFLSGLKFVEIGGDFRFLYLHSQKESTDSRDTFFPMQSDLYVAVSPTDHLTFYLQEGSGGPREYFGMIRNLPHHAYLKFGRFVPPYGLKLDDHTSFIREELRLGARDQDSGVEAGFSDGPLFAHAAVINGNPGSPNTGDDNTGKGFSGTAGLRSRHVTIGGSYYANKGLNDKRNYAGVYAMAGAGPVAWLAEWDLVRVADLSGLAGVTRKTGSVWYQELDYSPFAGWVFKAKYDRFDPDRRRPDDEHQRITAAVDVYPYAYTELSAQYRRNLERPARLNDQWLLLLHLFF